MEWNEKSLMTNEVTKKHVAKYIEIRNRGKFLIPLLIYWNSFRNIIKRSPSGRDNNKIPLLINYIITSIKDKIFIYLKNGSPKLPSHILILTLFKCFVELQNHEKERRWDINLLRGLFNPYEVELILSIPLSHAPVEDKMVCALQFNGCLYSKVGLQVPCWGKSSDPYC